jgi:hypothetical protein
MNQWEYTIIKLTFTGKGFSGTQPELLALGKDGWEAVGAWESDKVPHVILKRPLESKKDN